MRRNGEASHPELSHVSLTRTCRQILIDLVNKSHSLDVEVEYGDLEPGDGWRRRRKTSSFFKLILDGRRCTAASRVSVGVCEIC